MSSSLPGTSFPVSNPPQLPKISGNRKRSLRDPRPNLVKRRKLGKNFVGSNQSGKQNGGLFPVFYQRPCGSFNAHGITVESLHQIENWRCKAQSSVSRQCSYRKRAPLSEKNLRIHSRSMPRSRKTPTIPSITSRATSSTSTTTDKRFGKQLTKNGVVYGQLRAQEAVDAAEIRGFLNRARESNSPDEQDYKEYIAEVEHGENEITLQSNVWPLLAKRPGRTCAPGYAANYNFQWTEVDNHLTIGLSSAKPDISESYRDYQYPNGADEALGGALCPTQHSGAMPTFCVEWKGPDNSMLSAEKQCAYDGALMADAALEAHLYMQKDQGEFNNKTQALTIALNGESVRLYGCHIIQTKEIEQRIPEPLKKPKTMPFQTKWRNDVTPSIPQLASLQYHHFELNRYLPGKSPAALKETCRQIRNAQDWARQRATRTKDELNAFVSEQQQQQMCIQNYADATILNNSLTEDEMEVSDEQKEGEEEALLQPVVPAVTPPPSTITSRVSKRKKKIRRKKLHKIK